MGKKIKRAVLWVIAVAMALIVVVPVLLYIPAVQNFAKNIAIKEVKKSTGLDISIGYLRIGFPLKINLEKTTVVEASGDTMAMAGNVAVDISLLPILRGDINVAKANLTDVFYRMGTPDSALYLIADIDNFDLETSSINLMKGDIDVSNALLDGGRVTLLMKDTVTTEKTDSASAANFKITARNITLRNVSYTMSMMPVIDSLGARIGEATLHEGLVDMQRQKIHAASLSVDSVTATYLTPSAAYLAEHAETASPDSTEAEYTSSKPWTVTADTVRLNGGAALYAMRDAKPQPGLDMNYLQASDINISVDSFYNRAQSITVPLRNLSATERCGLSITANGTFKMDSTAIYADNFIISTILSTIRLDACMGLGDLMSDKNLPLRLLAKANIAMPDIKTALPSVKPMLKDLGRASELRLNCNIDGTTAAIDVNDIALELPRHLRMSARGSVKNPMDFKNIGGSIDIVGSIINVDFIKPTVLEAKMAKELNIPRTTIRGRINYSPNLASGKISVITPDGRMAMNGRWNQRAKGYDAALDVDTFSVSQFMPSLGVGKVTAKATVTGKGYDILSPSTDIDADIDVIKLEYLDRTYQNLAMKASLHEGKANGTLISTNPEARINAVFDATLSKEEYTWSLNGDVENLNLTAMNITTGDIHGSMNIKSDGSFKPATQAIDATIDINKLDWRIDANSLTTPSIKMNVASSDSTIHASLTSGDIMANCNIHCGLDSFMGHMDKVSATVDTMIMLRNVNVRALQRALPPLDMLLTAGRRNFITEYLKGSKMGFRSASLNVKNDTLLTVNSKILRFNTGDTRLDTITFDANQHGKYLVYKLSVNNHPGTLDNFAHVNLNGFVADDRVSAFLRQKNINDKQGFFLGVNMIMSDSIATLKLVPYKPTIGYKQWTVNSDNLITFNFTDKHFDANLKLESDSSYLKLLTEHVEGGDGHQEDVILKMSNIQIADWLSISLFAPPIKGFLGADMRFRWDEKQLTGTGMVDLNELHYGRDRVGSFLADLEVVTKRNGSLQANASLMVDSVKVITAVGSLNDTTAAEPFILDFSMIKLPLRIVNPFLPKNMARLSGTLNGRMDITGEMTSPIFNGYLDFDSTSVAVGMLGSTFRFSEEKIPVDSNVVVFKDFFISGVNENDLYVNGTVDMRNLSDIAMDLSLNARNMQIVNSSRAKGADVYGRAFIDFDAKIKGNMEWLNINANATLLPGSNVTYVRTDAESVLASQNTGDMVRFVEFNDSLMMNETDTTSSSSIAMNINAGVRISNGTTINVDLSTDGKNKVSIQGDGSLEYSMTPMNSNGRLTGRFNINGGFARYTPPFMSEKLFTFSEGSYVAFNGDILNPTLNIHAVDQIKANVTQEGQNSRLVNFDVSLSVTNTLANMNVAFDLSTDDDITVENELSAMSPEQRANQAMNMLLYNVYTGPGTRGNASLGGNPLYSFLESTLNSWAAKNIRGVDISFGIDQYDKTTNGSTASTTSYSYRVSKSLFNDRFKIIVGGNYSTDDNADENFSQNLINDISFEYMLNKRGTMYVRIFRHTGYESILEGEITQTGVGFVLKRKINSLRDLFRWAGRLRRKLLPENTNATTTTSNSTDEPTKSNP